jgi:alcohol dehydrogenase (cytochrome c)
MKLLERRVSRAATPSLTIAAVLGMVLTYACGAPVTNYPVTVTGHGTATNNDRVAGNAPDVARTVNSDRIAKADAEPQNWLTYYGTYNGQRFSRLAQVTPANVRSLGVAWQYQEPPLGLMAGQVGFSLQAAPIVVDGVMYMTGPDAVVWALDAATGAVLWKYQHAVSLDTPLCCGTSNRGVAVADGKVMFATPSGHMIALDAVTGKLIWNTTFLDVRAGESSTAAPLVVKHLVLIGSAGAEFGVRGHIDAFDIATGRRVWRRYNVPKPGEPGSETWPAKGDAWARGGGTAWTTGTYDPELNLLYWGIANPGPLFTPEVREGDNLFTNSIVALNPDNGELKWYFQTTPHDQWDYDAVSEPILFDRDGRKLLVQFNKNGYYYVLDRVTGKLLHALPFVRTTWGDVDSLTGKVTVRLTPSEKGTVICPGAAGGKEWTHASYSPRTQLIYVPVIEQCATFVRHVQEFREGLGYWGSVPNPVAGEHWGYVKAIDPVAGKEVWAYRTKYPVVASVLSTASDLVFAGEASGEFDALDARTGKLLWQLQTGSGIHSSPVTYSVAGKQYFAVPSGWGGWVKGFAPELAASPHGDAIVAFALR